MYSFLTYIISLPQAHNRLATVFNTLPSSFSGKNIKVFPAIDGTKVSLPDWWISTPGRYGCYNSHMQILQEIVDKNLENTLILEDDAIFVKDFDDIFKRSFTELPEDWDQFYLGGNHTYIPKQINHNLLKGQSIINTHAYMIKNAESAQKILSFFPNVFIDNCFSDKYHIDMAYAYLHIKSLINAYSTVPFIVGQDSDSISYCNNTPKKRPMLFNHRKLELIQKGVLDIKPTGVN